MTKKIKLCGLLNLFLAVTLLAGCGGGGTPPGPSSAVIDISHNATLGYTFGANDNDQVKRFQTFVADTHQSITSIEVKIRKWSENPYNNISVELYETDNNHLPSTLLATSSINTGSLGDVFTVVSASLTYHGLTAGESYAIVLSQMAGGNFNDSGYEWCAKSLSDNYYFGKYNGSAWTDESNLGDGWLKAHVDNSSGNNSLVPGQSQTCTVGGASFAIQYVPGAASFPTGLNDTGDSSVSGPYWIAESIVTYQLWSVVYAWATDNARGANKYTFAVTGRQGGNNGAGPVGTIQHPVTEVPWRDATIWCNALTEYYYGNSSNCVYYSDVSLTTPIRSADRNYLAELDLTPGSEDNPYINLNAKGFRLPTSMEWELAARYKGSDCSNGAVSRGDYFWTSGNYASGAADYAWNNSSNQANSNPTPTQTVAVYNTTGTAAVKSKAANALGLYDMSGNVWQWCTDWYPGSTGAYRVSRGGSWYTNAKDLQVGNKIGYHPARIGSDDGFRVARTQ